MQLCLPSVRSQKPDRGRKTGAEIQRRSLFKGCDRRRYADPGQPAENDGSGRTVPTVVFGKREINLTRMHKAYDEMIGHDAEAAVAAVHGKQAKAAAE